MLQYFDWLPLWCPAIDTIPVQHFAYGWLINSCVNQETMKTSQLETVPLLFLSTVTDGWLRPSRRKNKFQVACLDEAAHRVKQQKISKVLLSPCGIHHSSVTVSHAMLPWGSKAPFFLNLFTVFCFIDSEQDDDGICGWKKFVLSWELFFLNWLTNLSWSGTNFSEPVILHLIKNLKLQKEAKS